MSERLKAAFNFAERLSTPQKDFLKNIYKFRYKKINWDIDQVLSDSEIPVKRFFDKLEGTRLIDEIFLDGWNPITAHVIRNGHKEPERILKLEEALWNDPEVLNKSEPNYALRRFSLQASWNDVVQSVTTSRIPNFEYVTSKWVQRFFPWIEPELIMQNNNPEITGNDFKLNALLKLAPDVHFEDSMKFIRMVRSANPDIGIIGFPYANDEYVGIEADNVVFFPDRKTFEDVSYILF